MFQARGKFARGGYTNQRNTAPSNPSKNARKGCQYWTRGTAKKKKDKSLELYLATVSKLAEWGEAFSIRCEMDVLKATILRTWEGRRNATKKSLRTGGLQKGGPFGNEA